MKYIVYIRTGQQYDIQEFNSLGNAHTYFNNITKYEYKELSIDDSNKITIIRKLYKEV